MEHMNNQVRGEEWILILEPLIFQQSNLSLLADHLNLLRSDHSQFWIINNVDYFASLPAVLLSDLGQFQIFLWSQPVNIFLAGPYRGHMRDCYHKQCDNYNATRGKINWTFYTRTIQTLIGRSFHSYKCQLSSVDFWVKGQGLINSGICFCVSLEHGQQEMLLTLTLSEKPFLTYSSDE